MQSTFFWREWPRPYRTLWLLSAAVFLLSLLYLAFTWYQGPAGVIDWERVQDQKTVETTVHDFQLGPFHLNVPGESYVIFEYLEGSFPVHNQFASMAFLVALTLATMLMLTVASAFRSFWYYAAIALFSFFAFSLRLDVLVLFGVRGYAVPAVVAVCFIGLSFYFKSFRPATPFATRLLAFCGLAGIVAGVIYLFSSLPYPFLHLVANAYLPALVITVLFIVMVSHEILVSFVYITSQGSSKSLRHFLLISVIYLVNVWITCLHEIGTITWDFFYLNVYLLLAISAILGIWGFRLREPLYASILPFRPSGALLYLALGAIALFTISQFLGNNNDPALKIVRDIIIFSHAGYGLIFLTYIFSNFMVMMARNLPVYRLLYKPNRMPYVTFQLAGLAATLALIFYSSWRDYVYHGLGGFYTYIGDLYVMQGRPALAQDFFDESRKLAFQSHRANYALGAMFTSRLDFDDAHYHYNLANAKNPSSFSLVNKGNLYLWEKDYFAAIRSLRHSREKLSQSPVLANNLGYAYGKVHALDSATWFISQARKHQLTRSAAEGNFLALAGVENIPIRVDSVARLFDTAEPLVTANALALATLFDQTLHIDNNPLADTVLNLYSATLLNNYIIYHAHHLDTAFINKAYAIASDSLNQYFEEALKASLAHTWYLRGNVTRALEVLAELAYTSYEYGGKYNYIMGLFALDQGKPDIASSYFTHAETADYKDSRFYNAIALTEAGRVPAALIAWDSIARKPDTGEQEIANRLRRILTLPQQTVANLSDADKYQYCRYRVGTTDTLFFDRISNTFNSADYKAQALLDMAVRQFNAGDVRMAIRYLNRISGLELSDEALYNKVRHTELRMLAWQRDLTSLAQQINAGIDFPPERTLEKVLYTSMLHEASGEMEEAQKGYRIAGTWNPYFEEGVIIAADFFRRHEPESLTAYNMLVEAIQVNYNSYRLLAAYEQEATRKGLDAYAESARERMVDILTERND